MECSGYTEGNFTARNQEFCLLKTCIQALDGTRNEMIETRNSFQSKTVAS